MYVRGDDDLDHWENVWGGAIAHGHIESIAYDIDELTEEEFRRFRQERDEAFARKRPCGFTTRYDD